ncbi:MAG: hypothetical protein ACREJM_09785, partial [Candidatus Saccharimonadales bacterium]
MSGNTVAYAIDTAYDADHEVTSQSDPDSSYAFTQDNLGRTLTDDNAGTPNVPHVVLTSGYDPVGDRTSLSATINGKADFLNSYSFDADQRLIDETQQGVQGGNGVDPKQVEFGYNALGQFTAVSRFNFVGIGPMVDLATGVFSYDAANRLTGLNYTYGGGAHSIDAYTWALNNADLVTSVNSTADGTASYGYDPTNQLTSANYTGTNAPPNAAYAFDKNGNRTMTGYQVAAGNEIASDGTFNYQFDGEGNRTLRTRISNASASDYQTKFFYDYRNRLTDEEYFNNSGTLTKHVHYRYDTLDHEIGKQVDDTGGGTYDRAEWYVLDVSPAAPLADAPSGALADPLLQFDPSCNLQFRYFSGHSPAGNDTVYTEEQISTQGQAGAETWPLGDNENTPHEVVNNASAVVDHIIGNTFGVVSSESNSSIHHWSGFEGAHLDMDTAAIDDYFRWY